jgi:hypothetical protein
MAMPIDQSTYTYNDIVTLMNQELQLGAVPSLIEVHEEYFTYKVTVPLVQNISIYPIPDRTMGMALRDLKYSDAHGNFFDMSRIAPEDLAFFQNNTGINQVLGHYYLQGNNVVLTPQTMTNPTGYLNFFIYLRPNYLVRNDRATNILNFIKYITITNDSSIVAGDEITIVTANQTPNPIVNTFIAVNNSPQTITTASISTNNQTTTITTAYPHNIPSGTSFQVTISGGTGYTPSIDGVFSASSTGNSTFTIPVPLTVAGSGGSYSIVNQFVFGNGNAATASNLNSAMLGAGLTSQISSPSTTGTGAGTANNVVVMSYADVSDTFLTTAPVTNNLLTGIIDIDVNSIYIQFDNNFQSDYIDPDTQETSSLYTTGSLVDFLQTLPGHKTYTYNVTLQNILPNFNTAINSGGIGQFDASALQTYQINGSNGVLTYYPILIGDYICLQNECIIPGIPPELHQVLAERTCSRLLMAIGDRDGYAVSQQKLAEMNKNKDTLIGSRVEGSVNKVFNKNNLLRCGKRTVRRRFL